MFEPVNSWKWYDLNFVEERTCAKIPRYLHLCDRIKLPCMRFKRKLSKAAWSRGRCYFT